MTRHVIAFVLLAVGLLPATWVSAQTGASSTATGVSRLMNPAISVNGLLLGQVSRDDNSREANQFALQEMETRFTAVVDPFWTADLTVSISPSEDPDAGTEYGTEVEMARLLYRNAPRGFGLKIGKDHLDFGKASPLHSHARPFVDSPLGISAFLGDESVPFTGLEVAWNAPLPWFSEVLAYVSNADAEFFDEASRDPAYGFRMTNLWDTSDASTLELGFSGLHGPQARPDVGLTGPNWQAYGADLTWKWVSPTRSQGPAVYLTNELLIPDPDGKEGSPLGFYSILQYRFRRNWWLGLTGSIAQDVPATDGGLVTMREAKANLTLAPSEFSAVRFEVRYQEELDGSNNDLSGAVQFNFTMGSHPAHAY